MLRRCNSKKLFGVTIHKNMSASDLKSAWDRVPKELRAKFPEISNAFAAAEGAEKAVTEIIPKYETAKKALEVQKEAVMTSAASFIGNVTYPITKAAEAAAKISIENITQNALDSVTKAVETLLDKMLAAGGCSQIDEEKEDPNVSKESKEDEL